MVKIVTHARMATPPIARTQSAIVSNPERGRGLGSRLTLEILATCIIWRIRTKEYKIKVRSWLDSMVHLNP